MSKVPVLIVPNEAGKGIPCLFGTNVISEIHGKLVNCHGPSVIQYVSSDTNGTVRNRVIKRVHVQDQVKNKNLGDLGFVKSKSRKPVWIPAGHEVIISGKCRTTP